MRKSNLLLVAAFAATGLQAQEQPLNAGRDESLLNEARHSMRIGCRWLARAQLPDGSWCRYPGITGLAVVALANSGLKEFGPRCPAVQRGVAYLVKLSKPDGSIYDRDLKCYNTSIAVLALLSTGDRRYDRLIRRARRFLIASQFDEAMGYGESSPYFGGIGYGKHHRPDLSNTQWALEALRLSEFIERDAAKPLLDPNLPVITPEEAKGLYYARAVKFLSRCQNRRASNDQPWAGDDGGFIYRPGESKAGEADGHYRSYGSMTYAGLKSFIYARVDKRDPRVQAAYAWIRRHYTVDENPGMGLQGLFYNYHTMAKALRAYGEPALVDAAGRRHDWRRDLMRKLITIQNGEGYWVNSNGRWWENVKELSTSYALITLGILLRAS